MKCQILAVFKFYTLKCKLKQKINRKKNCKKKKFLSKIKKKKKLLSKKLFFILKIIKIFFQFKITKNFEMHFLINLSNYLNGILFKVKNF